MRLIRSILRAAATTRVPVLAAAAVLVLAVAACSSGLAASASGGSGSGSGGSGTSNGLTDVTFAGAGTPNGVDGAPAYCAYSGVCAKYGIDLHIVYPASGGTQSDAAEIANNTFQMAGIAGPALLQEYESGVHLIAVANSYSKNLLGLSVRAEGPDASITTPADLKGKTIAVSAGSGSQQVLAAFLQHYGVAPSEYRVETMNLSALVTAFVLGKVDAAVTYPMDTSPQFNASGAKTRNFYFSTVPGLSYLYEAWTMSPTWVAAHKQVTKNLVKALEVSTEDAAKDPAAAAADVVKSSPHTAPTLAVTTAQWKGNIPFLMSSSDTGHPYVYMAAADWAAALSYGEKYEGLKPMDPAKVYTNVYDPAS